MLSWGIHWHPDHIDVETHAAASAGTDQLAGPAVIIPAYFYPVGSSSPWSAVLSTPGIGMVIINVDNGPGVAADPNYLAAIAAARAAGINVLGYVYTDYTARSAATVEGNIDAWQDLYGIADIFLDEVSGHPGNALYYQALTAYVHRRTPDSQVILNPGVVPSRDYMDAGDIVVTFEGDYSSYLCAAFPSRVADYPADRFCHIIYGVSSRAAMVDVLVKAEQNHVGYIYVTDGNLPNPYDTVPPYLADETSSAPIRCEVT